MCYRAKTVIKFDKMEKICYTLPEWCSILVRAAFSKDGPKNPLKGISMKFLVLASNAQFGVGAGS